MNYGVTTVKDYLAAVPADRRAAIVAVRDVVNRSLPKGYRETIAYGMIAWVVPLETCPDTYNGQPLLLAALASQKNHMAVYLMTRYADDAVNRAFREGFAKAGKKLDEGKSCVRFRRLEELHLPAIAELIARVPVATFVARANAAHSPEGRAERSAARAKAKAAGKAKPATKVKRAAKAKPPAKPKRAAKAPVRSAHAKAR